MFLAPKVNQGHTSGRMCKRVGLGHLFPCAKSAHEPIDWTSKHLSVSAELPRFTHNHKLFLLFHFCCLYFEECFHSFKTDQPKTGLKMKTKDRENQKKEKLCYRNYLGIPFFSTDKKEEGKSIKIHVQGKQITSPKRLWLVKAFLSWKGENVCWIVPS